MSKQTDTNLFMVPPLAKYAGLYQGLLQELEDYTHLGNRLIHLGEQAHAFRQFDKVQEIGLILSNIPLKQYQPIGLYFLAIAANRKGNGDQEKARRLYELVADTAPSVYKAKAILSLAAVSSNTGDFKSSYYYYNEAIKAAGFNAISIDALKGIAVLKAREGYHAHAVTELESILPYIKHAPPQLYYDLLNSYAVELGETGRKDEARNISRIVLASPFAPAYPEWQETARDLKEPIRSFVSVPSIDPEPVEIETIEAHHASEPEQPATILSFPTLKEAPQPQKPDRLSPQEISELTTSEKRELILAALRTGTFTPFDYDRFMLMVGLLRNEPADKILDLEDEETISDIAVVWANQVEPEQFAAVMSAIRDCEDRNRLRDIIDKMIRIAFQETQLCGLTEEAWRLRFERRLPKNIAITSKRMSLTDCLPHFV
jgi:tetratricopeptide (TPR) repeat protein